MRQIRETPFSLLSLSVSQPEQNFWSSNSSRVLRKRHRLGRLSELCRFWVSSFFFFFAKWALKRSGSLSATTHRFGLLLVLPCTHSTRGELMSPASNRFRIQESRAFYKVQSTSCFLWLVPFKTFDSHLEHSIFSVLFPLLDTIVICDTL